MPQPSAEMIVWISECASILSRRAFSTFRILPLSGRIAWKRRSRPSLAEPPAESPSTRNSSDSSKSRLWQSASLPGIAQVARAPRRLARLLRVDGLLDDRLGGPGVLLEVGPEALAHHRLDQPLGLAV